VLETARGFVRMLSVKRAETYDTWIVGWRCATPTSDF
jgi:hypothetical protein